MQQKPLGCWVLPATTGSLLLTEFPEPIYGIVEYQGTAKGKKRGRTRESRREERREERRERL